MKILNIIEEGRFGGPHKRIAEVAKLLQRKGISTLVIMPNKDSDRFQQYLNKNEVQFQTISLHRITKDFKHLLGYFFFFIPELFQIVRIIKNQNIDVVHCNGAFQIKGIIASKIARVKNVWHLNDTYMPLYIRMLFFPVAYLMADSFIVACNRTQQYYLNNRFLKNRHITTIQAPVETSVFSEEIVEKESSEISNYKGHKITMVGNLNPVKGHETFIRMAHHYGKKDNFFVVGKFLENQKAYSDSLLVLKEKLNLENLYFLGASDHVKNILNDTDIYICSSTFEASPIAVWEALSMSKPVISTDVGDVKEIFEKDNCGITVPVGDYISMSENLTHLIQNQSLQNQLKINARQTAINRFDINSCASRHKEAYVIAYIKKN